jgi:hypothetical protein
VAKLTFPIHARCGCTFRVTSQEYYMLKLFLQNKSKGFWHGFISRKNQYNLICWTKPLAHFRLATEFIKRQLFSMSRICDVKCSKPKIFLAFLSNLLCFSFIL